MEKKLLWDEIEDQSTSFSLENGRISRLYSFYRISNHKNFIPNYLDNAIIDLAYTSWTSRRLSEEKPPVNYLRRRVSSTDKYGSK